MTQPTELNIYWRDLHTSDIVIEYKTHFQTDSGALIYWLGQESTEAQKHLKNRANTPINNTEMTTEVIQVISECTIDGNIVRLPAGQLDRKLYDQVKNVLQKATGKWKGGKIGGFVFDHDPEPLLKRILSGDQVNIKKEYQFYATPQKLAFDLVRRAYIQNTDVILEPSAGDGAIVREIQKLVLNNDIFGADLHLYEIMPENIKKLEYFTTIDVIGLDTTFIGKDFLTPEPKWSMQRYDKIIANPPFSKNQDIIHIKRMYDLLNPGGKLVSVCSNHPWVSSGKTEGEFIEWLESDKINATITNLDNSTFKESGANVSSVIIEITKK